MKTDDLISALAADREMSGPNVQRAGGIALAAGVAVSLLVFLLIFGVRLDIAAALQTWRFDLKLAIIAVAVVAAMVDCIRSTRPEPRPAPALSLIAMGLLTVAVVLELASVPMADWQSSLLGSNAVMCLVSIPFLSLAPLIALLVALRSGAPVSPMRAGVAIGVLAAACGAALYATHCDDDSPLFVATWYLLAAVPVIGLGAAVGSRVLKW
jgi:hypothetical protein